MQSKLLKLFFALSFSLGIFGSSVASAAITVVPYGVPNTVVAEGYGPAVYYLDEVLYSGEGAPGYAAHDFRGGTVFEFTISGADAAQGFFWVMAQDKSDSNTYYPVKLNYCNAGGVATEGRCDSGGYTDFRIGIDFHAVCASITYGPNIRGCTAGDVGTGTSPIAPFRLRFLSGTTAVPTNPIAHVATLLQIFPQTSAPTVNGPLSPGFFPGDRSVIIDTDAITATPNAASGSSPVFLYTWVTAEQGGVITPGDEMLATLRTTVGYKSGQQEAKGFKNSTKDTQFFYQMAIGVQDSAGAIGFGTTIFTNVFATDIKGFLKESNCFVATASYRDGRATGVMLLRHFRDEVLSEFQLGRDFISWYYTYGPVAADWLIEHPIFRGFFLMLLLPLQAIALITLHLEILILPLLGMVLVAYLLRRERRKA